MSIIRFVLKVMLFLSAMSVIVPAVGSAEEEGSRKVLVRQGARLWSPYCGSCHNARPPVELSPAEWDTVMMHMRARANLSGDDTRALLEYLKQR